MRCDQLRGFGPVGTNEPALDDARDAARYRWLRMHAHPTVVIPCPDGIAGCLVEHRRPAWGDALDAAIDAKVTQA